MNRRNTNKFVMETANNLLLDDYNPWKLLRKPKSDLQIHSEKLPVIKISTFIQTRAASLLGHIIRRENNDPMRQATLKPNGIRPQFYKKNRAGAPRVAWVHETLKYVWHYIRNKTGHEGIEYNKKSRRQRLLLHTAALSKHF